MSYIFDTCAWIGAWEKVYPVELFPNLWEKFSELIGSGTIYSVQKVRDEIRSGVSLPAKKGAVIAASSQELVKWMRNHRNLRLPPNQEKEDLVSEIINSEDGKRLITRKRPDPADPHVIARAEIEEWTVVTQEGVGGNGIPAVCEKRGVKCINLIDFFREQGWRFHLR